MRNTIYHLAIATILLVLFLIAPIPLFNRAVTSVAQQLGTTDTPVPTSAPTSSVTQTSIALPSPVASPQATLSYEQVLTLYGNFSTEIAKSAQNTVTLVQWVIAIIAGISAIITTVAGFMYRQANRAQVAAKHSAEQAQKSQTKIEQLQVQIEDTLKKLKDAEHNLEALRQEVKYLLPNLEVLDTIIELEARRVRLFSDSDIDRNVARDTLIEYSKDDNPIIRRMCASIFGSLSQYRNLDIVGSTIRDRLLELRDKDVSQGVRYEAKLALELLDELASGKGIQFTSQK